MPDTIRISVVSYLNSKPFIYGLKNADLGSAVEIQEDIPSVCAEKIMTGKADIGLIPVAVLKDLRDYKIISDYCIGADGDVSSVLLLSEVPLNEIETILLDYQSRTSVVLARILAEKFWNISPQWKSSSENYETKISGSTAGVVIGDRALMMRKKFSFVYDLSGEWKKFTGLPFVFACWVSNRELKNDFISKFNSALEDGLNQINSISEKETNANLSSEMIKHYLTKNIDYKLDTKKKEALEKFFGLMQEIITLNKTA